MGKKVLIIVVAVIAIAVVALVWIKKVNSKKEPKMTIQITSSAFGQGSPIPEKYTCKGEGANPDLKISGVPTKAKSLVLIVDDPDAPAGLWTHWLLINIDPTTAEIAENSTPAGAVVGQNSSGTMKYEGPCPPSGTHRYYFRIYALDIKLNLPPSYKRQELDRAIEGRVLARGELMGKFSK